MSLDSQQPSPPKRPRLSLQIKPAAAARTLGKSTTALNADIDLSSPTALNTLSNAYAAAMENASPRSARPLAAKSTGRTSLRLETSNITGNGSYVHHSHRTQTPGPFSIADPDTPSSACPSYLKSPSSHSQSEPQPVPAHFTVTPPQSAGSERPVPRIFTFAANSGATSPSTPRTPRRRVTICGQSAPYSHPRALHSILRNSPLPPRSSVTPATSSQVLMRPADKSSKKVGYNDPLTQTITTNKYVKSHIELLAEDSPHSATDPEAEQIEALDSVLGYTDGETRDGGQTPGPFEEMQRRMAESDFETPATRKRKRREKKRKWEWTINATEMDDGDDEPTGRAPLTAVMLEQNPISAIRRVSSESESSEGTEDSEMEDRDEAGSGHSDDGGQPTTSQSL